MDRTLKNSSNAINQIQRNPLLKTIGAVNNDGMIDVDSIFECLREAANKYGDIVIAIPFMGDITLKPNDVELLKRYIL